MKLKYMYATFVDSDFAMAEKSDAVIIEAQGCRAC
jgi:hypothetical protein